jgi:hypothetical protein
MRVNGDHRIHLVNDRSCLFNDVCRVGEDGGGNVYMGICTKLEVSLSNKVLIWINCWISPFPAYPSPPVQSDLVIWLIWVLMIELQIGIAVEV